MMARISKPGEHDGWVKLSLGAPSHKVKSEAVKKTIKKKNQEMIREVLEGFSRFMCLGCIFLKSLDMFSDVGLTFSVT